MQGEHVPADARTARLRQPQDRRRRHRGIHGVAALLQDPQPRLRRQWLTGRHGTVARQDFGTALAAPATVPAAAHGREGGGRLTRGRRRLTEGARARPAHDMLARRRHRRRDVRICGDRALSSA
jgi:hypothetical protein